MVELVNVYLRNELVEKFYELRAQGKIPMVEIRDFVNQVLEKALNEIEGGEKK